MMIVQKKIKVVKVSRYNTFKNIKNNTFENGSNEFNVRNELGLVL